jgi:hypothetical protein
MNNNNNFNFEKNKNLVHQDVLLYRFTNIGEVDNNQFPYVIIKQELMLPVKKFYWVYNEKGKRKINEINSKLKSKFGNLNFGTLAKDYEFGQLLVNTKCPICPPINVLKKNSNRSSISKESDISSLSI